MGDVVGRQYGVRHDSLASFTFRRHVMDECCRNCRIAKLVAKSTVLGLLIGGVWTCATIGIIAIWGGM